LGFFRVPGLFGFKTPILLTVHIKPRKFFHLGKIPSYHLYSDSALKSTPSYLNPLLSFIEPTYCSETPLEHSPSLSCPFDWITVSVLFSVGVVHSIVLGVIVYFVVRFNRYLRRHVPLTTIPFTAARRLRTVGTRAPMEEVSLEWANN